jgi:hypothetical protein
MFEEPIPGMRFYSENRTQFFSNFPPHVVPAIFLDVRVEIAFIDDMAMATEEEVDVAEFLAKAYDCISIRATKEAEICMMQEELLENAPDPYGAITAKQLSTFELVAERLSDQMRMHNLYFQGRLPYVIARLVGRTLILIRADIHRAALGYELERQNNHPRHGATMVPGLRSLYRSFQRV